MGKGVHDFSFWSEFVQSIILEKANDKKPALQDAEMAWAKGEETGTYESGALTLNLENAQTTEPVIHNVKVEVVVDGYSRRRPELAGSFTLSSELTQEVPIGAKPFHTLRLGIQNIECAIGINGHVLHLSEHLRPFPLHEANTEGNLVVKAGNGICFPFRSRACPQKEQSGAYHRPGTAWDSDRGRMPHL
jgi:hypothetical protein